MDTILYGILKGDFNVLGYGNHVIDGDNLCCFLERIEELVECKILSYIKAEELLLELVCEDEESEISKTICSFLMDIEIYM